MTPQEFIDKWDIDTPSFSELFNLSYSQAERLFFPITAKNHQIPTESLTVRLGEIDLILETRSRWVAMRSDPRLKRIFDLVPESKTI